MQVERLHPFHRDPQGIIVAQIVELRPAFPFDGGDPPGDIAPFDEQQASQTQAQIVLER